MLPAEHSPAITLPPRLRGPDGPQGVPRSAGDHIFPFGASCLFFFGEFDKLLIKQCILGGILFSLIFWALESPKADLRQATLGSVHKGGGQFRRPQAIVGRPQGLHPPPSKAGSAPHGFTPKLANGQTGA